MKRRMVDGGIWANEKFAELPCMARLLQIGLVTLADDQGRIKAHPSYLRSQLFPYDEDVSITDIRKWLCAIAGNGTAIVYHADDKEYVQLTNWWEYQSLQYAMPSEYPRPDGWQDRIRYNAKGGMTLTCNWTTPKGETPMDTCDQDGDPLPIVSELPPRNPGGRPPENSGGNTNKEQIKNKTNKEGDRAHATNSVQPKPGEYLPGLPLPRYRRVQYEADHMASQRNKLGLTATQLTALTDAVLERMNATQIAALDTDIGNDEHRLAQEAALALAVLGHKTPEAIGIVYDTWYTHDYRGEKGSPPNYKQIVDHAKAMPKLLAGRKAEIPKLSEDEKGRIRTRANLARSSLQTAQKFGGHIDPAWQQDIETARGLGL
jgi:hypothetical protein